MKFTVFTPTYNRAALLGDVWEALKNQNLKDFEWLIVDDGSTDGTESFVRNLMREHGRFPIRYVKKENGGKHTAWNLAVDMAQGELFLPLDSDDSCVPETLDTLWARWTEIDGRERENYSGVTALSRFKDGAIIGTRFPSDIFDGTHIGLIENYGMYGDKMSCFRTTVLREYKFPVWPRERFVTEALVFNRLERRYKTRFVNDVLQIKEYLPGGLTAKTVQMRKKSVCATCCFYSELVGFSSAGWPRLRAMTNFMRFALFSGKSAVWGFFPLRHTIYGIPALPVAFCYGTKDLFRRR